MSYVNWQDPGTREIRSTDISGLQEIVSKLERSVGMETVSETDIPLTEVYISENDRWRIFQAPEGKRNWVSEPAPVIKRDGVPIDIGFVIDYGAGAIILATNDTEEHTYTADATYIKSLQTSLNEELATHLAEDVTQGDTPHGLIYEEGTWTPTYQPENGTFGNIVYDLRAGRYVRMGNLVYVEGHIACSVLDKGSASGVLMISGLPFACIGDVGATVTVAGFNSFNFVTLPNQVIMRILQNTIRFLNLTYTDGASSITVDNLKTHATAGWFHNNVRFSGVYKIG